MPSRIWSALTARSRLRALELKLNEIERERTEEAERERTRADGDQIRTLRARARFVERLQDGEPIEDALVWLVRNQLDAGDHLSARSLCQSLQARPATRVAGCLGSALIAAATRLPALAWHSFQAVPAPLWRRLAAPEYFRTGFQRDPVAAGAVARELVDDPPADLPPDGWIALVRAAFGAGEQRLAAAALGVADALAGRAPGEWAATDGDRDWLRRWLERAVRPVAPPAVPPDHVRVAVLDYKQPDHRRTSKNLEDYVQTLAGLGQLARHQNLRFHGPGGPTKPAGGTELGGPTGPTGPTELAELAGELRDRVRPEERLDTAGRDVTLLAVNRDASAYDAVPEGTWLIAAGRFMESVFGRYDFPPHPNLRPIFVSFHCDRPAMLTPAAIDYLRRYGPVGCRDWTTVDLLLGLGVPAFFTGCVTATVDTAFPGPAAEGPALLAAETDQVRRDGLATNLRRAIALLEGYRGASGVITSRLHCYLPARALGVDVEFRPPAPVDIRFDGLTGLTDEAYAGMRDGLRGRLAAILGTILTGTPEPEVYARWRELCAPDVAKAERRRTSLPPMPPPSFDVPAACRLIRSRQVEVNRTVPGAGEPAVHVALALDGNLREELPVVVEAMVANSSSPLRLWILCRDHDERDYRRFAALFPGVGFTWLPCDAVDYGPVAGMLKHITVSTMDRLLLPELLPELERIVYHDIDALPLADITELYRWDLGGHPLAARSAVASDPGSGFRNVRRSAKRLRAEPAVGYECVRRVYARHGRSFPSFNAGILVLDLARMRADRFSEEFIPYAERYGMNDQEVLNCYAGAGRAGLPPQWNSLPAQEPVTDPRIIHWAGPLKPWQPGYVLFREVWDEYRARVREREPRTG